MIHYHSGGENFLCGKPRPRGWRWLLALMRNRGGVCERCFFARHGVTMPTGLPVVLG